MQIKIDHATVCGAELTILQRAFAESGLVTDYGGPHANGVTHMGLLGFEDGSYLELIAPLKPGSAEGSPWGTLMSGDAGPGAWAIVVDDMEAQVASLGANGIIPAGPESGSRRRPDGKLVQWQTASVGPGAPGAMLPFLIQDHTPREWRVQPSSSLKGSAIIGIGTVVLGVRSLDPATALFRRAYGWGAPRVEDHAEFNLRIAHFPGTPVMLAAALDLAKDGWLRARLENFGEIPAAFLLKAADMKQAKRRFQLTDDTKWFNRLVAWFEPDKLRGIRLGVVQA